VVCELLGHVETSKKLVRHKNLYVTDWNFADCLQKLPSVCLSVCLCVFWRDLTGSAKDGLILCKTLSLSLCTTCSHTHVVEVWLHPFLSSTLNRYELLHSLSRRFLLLEKNPLDTENDAGWHRHFREQKLNFRQPAIAARMNQYVVVTILTELSRHSNLYSMQIISVSV
jgi:hypothetical protein